MNAIEGPALPGGARLHQALRLGKPAGLWYAALHVTLYVTLYVTLSLCAGRPAQAETARAEPAAQVWLAASDLELDQLRGGFQLGDGLMVSFGISRVTYINDRLVASTELNLGPISGLIGQQAATLRVPLANALQGAAQAQYRAGLQAPLQAQWVQNGPGNFVPSDALDARLSTVIQNSLNDQLLRTQTIINASSNGLGLLRGLNLQRTLDLALTHALTGR